MSTGFISEKSLEEIKRKRQEEWEKVRKPEDPKEAPEEQHDPRSLYERLKEQKDKKEAEWEEAHKFKNMIRGLDDEEADFLDFVDKSRSEQESKILKEEKQEIEEYRKAVAAAEEQKLSLALKPSLPKVANSSAPVPKDSLKAKLAGLVRKRKASDSLQVDLPKAQQLAPPKSNLEVVAVLPGIGCYSDSDESENSSSSDESNNFTLAKAGNQLDLCGRPIVRHNDDD